MLRLGEVFQGPLLHPLSTYGSIMSTEALVDEAEAQP